MFAQSKKPLVELVMLLAICSTSAVEASVIVSTKPTSNMNCSGGVCTPTAKNAVLNISDLDGMLASGDATIASTDQCPDIEIDTKVSWSSTHRLTLDSYRSIEINKPIHLLAAGSLVFDTNDGGIGGDFRFFGKGRVEFKDVANGELSINGTLYRLVNTMKNLIRDTKHGSINIALGGEIDASHEAYSAAPIPLYNGGTFEGLGNNIDHLTIEVVDGGFNLGVGLIGTIEPASAISPLPVVRDLGLTSVNIISDGQQNYVGSLAGVNEGVIENSYATGQVSASGAQSYVGGLVGGSGLGSIINSSSNAAVSGTSQVIAVGGLVGQAATVCGPCEGLITQSYATGAVAGSDGVRVGGLVGENFDGWISNSYATGAVTGGNNSHVGGLIGINIDSPDNSAQPTLSSVYATGFVSAGTGADAGGLIGEDNASSEISAGYWDMDTSGISDPSKGAGNVANDPGIVGLTDAQLKSGLPAGFDKKVWKHGTLNSGYPYLKDFPPPH